MTNENGEIIKVFFKLLCMLRTIRLVKKVIDAIISLYIHETRSLACDPLLGFLKSLTLRHISKEDHVRDLILTN